MRLLVASLALLLAAVPAPALEWQTLHRAVKAGPLQRTAETAFEFRNTSDRTVTITGVDTSCDCLEATPSAKSFAPGASGRINARFTVGDRTGTYSRTIIVSTDDGREPAALTATLEVAEVATLTPRVVDWKLDAPATEQVVAIDVAPGVELALTSVQATSEAFTFRLETIAAGRRYALHVAPKGTAAVANAAFRLYGKAGTGQELVLSVYGNVR